MYFDDFLGKHFAISLTQKDHQREQTVHLRRLDTEVIELEMIDWEGMRWSIQVKFKEGLARLSRREAIDPADARILVNVIYKGVLEAMADEPT